MWPCCTSDIWIACRKTLSEVRGAAGVLSLWARNAALAVRPVLSVRTRVICRAPALAGPEVNLRLILHRTPVVQTFLSASPLSGVASRMTLLLSHFVIPRLTESGGIRVLPEWPRCRCRCRSGMVPWCQQWQLPLEASHCRSLILAGAPMAHGRATSARASCSSSGEPPAASHAHALPSPRHWLAPQDASALAGPSYLQPSQQASKAQQIDVGVVAAGGRGGRCWRCGRTCGGGLPASIPAPGMAHNCGAAACRWSRRSSCSAPRSFRTSSCTATMRGSGAPGSASCIRGAQTGCSNHTVMAYL